MPSLSKSRPNALFPFKLCSLVHCWGCLGDQEKHSVVAWGINISQNAFVLSSQCQTVTPHKHRYTICYMGSICVKLHTEIIIGLQILDICHLSPIGAPASQQLARLWDPEQSHAKHRPDIKNGLLGNSLHKLYRVSIKKYPLLLFCTLRGQVMLGPHHLG